MITRCPVCDREVEPKPTTYGGMTPECPVCGFAMVMEDEVDMGHHDCYLCDAVRERDRRRAQRAEAL